MATIEKRLQQDGKTKYRVRVRLRGHEEKTRTFNRLTDARDWARSIEDDYKRGRIVPTNEAARRTVADMVDRYVAYDLPRKERNRDANKTAALLSWWKGRIGRLAVANVTPALIAEQRDKLLSEDSRFGRPRKTSTWNRYKAALSGVYKVAIQEWHWTDRNPLAAVARGAEHPGVVRFLSDTKGMRYCAPARRTARAGCIRWSCWPCLQARAVASSWGSNGAMLIWLAGSSPFTSQKIARGARFPSPVRR